MSAGKGARRGERATAGAGRTSRASPFDELAYYAERFETVEINSTFYGQPREAVTAGWARRTPPGFEFSLKLYQKFTHPAMEAGRAKARRHRAGSSIKAGGADLDRRSQGPTQVGPRPATFDFNALAVSQADVDEYRKGLDPLARAGKLGAVLAQFPPSFKNSDRARDYLDWLLRAFHDYQIAVELRHRSWSDDVASTLALLNAYGAAWTQIDEPKFRFSIRQNFLPNVKGFYYMRLHGRNVARWWTHATSEDRYDYLYSENELKPYAEIAVAARTLVKKMYLYLNNHFAAKSAANALLMKKIVGQPITGQYPPELVERYPELADFVPIAPRALALSFS